MGASRVGEYYHFAFPKKRLECMDDTSKFVGCSALALDPVSYEDERRKSKSLQSLIFEAVDFDRMFHSSVSSGVFSSSLL